MCGYRSTAAHDGLFDSHVKCPTYFDLYLKKNSLFSYYRNDYFIKEIIKIFKRENFHASAVVNKEMAQNHILSAIDVEQKMKLFENVEATAPQHLETRVGCARNIHFVFPLNFIRRTLV